MITTLVFVLVQLRGMDFRQHNCRNCQGKATAIERSLNRAENSAPAVIFFPRLNGLDHSSSATRRGDSSRTKGIASIYPTTLAALKKKTYIQRRSVFWDREFHFLRPSSKPGSVTIYPSLCLPKWARGRRERKRGREKKETG